MSAVAHIASLFGVAIIQDRGVQKWLTWILEALLFSTLIRTARSTVIRVPRLWSIGTVITWTNALMYAACLPIGDPRNRMWPGTAVWLGLNGDDMLLVYAREASSVHLAIAVTLLVVIWFQPTAQNMPE
jgi:hypothetical protein